MKDVVYEQKADVDNIPEPPRNLANGLEQWRRGGQSADRRGRPKRQPYFTELSYRLAFKNERMIIE